MPSQPNSSHNGVGDTGLADKLGIPLYVVSSRGLSYYNTKDPYTRIARGPRGRLGLRAVLNTWLNRKATCEKLRPHEASRSNKKPRQPVSGAAGHLFQLCEESG